MKVAVMEETSPSVVVRPVEVLVKVVTEVEEMVEGCALVEGAPLPVDAIEDGTLLPVEATEEGTLLFVETPVSMGPEAVDVALAMPGRSRQTCTSAAAATSTQIWSGSQVVSRAHDCAAESGTQNPPRHEPV